MSIKTLHITNSYHPASGGIRTFYNAMLDAANRQRRLLRLVVPGPETHIEEVGEYGRIYYVAAPRVPVIDSRYRWMLPHLYAWRYDSPLRRILAAERPDLVEVCDKFWLLYLSGVLRRRWIPGVPVPVIVGLSCERLDDNMRTYISTGRAAETACRRYMRSCYVPRFDFHIAASEYVAGEVRRLLPARLGDRLYVCPMGVDFEAFAGAPAESGRLRQDLLRRVAGGEKTALLFYAGRLSKEKNLLILPQVMAQLAACSRFDYRLVIAGEGPCARELRENLQALAPGRSAFLGQCRREDLAALYHATEIFIHPNPREPFGIAPLEAMAAGLPLVVPASGGVLTYADGENSWLAARNTPAAFAAAVESVHADAAVHRRKVEKARATAAEFSWPRVTTNYFQLYDRFHDWHVRENSHHASIARPPLAHQDAGAFYSRAAR